MSFPASITIVFVLFSLIPGWLYLRRLEATQPAETQKLTGLQEILQLLAVGLSTTGIAIFIVAILPRGWPVDQQALLQGGHAYVWSHLRRVALALFLMFWLAMGFAELGFRWMSRNSPEGFNKRGNPWTSAFVDDVPKEERPRVVVEITDGRRFRGWLYAFDPERTSSLDLVSQGVIVVTGPDGAEDKRVVDLLVVASDQIVTVEILHEIPPPEPDSSSPDCWQKLRSWSRFRIPTWR